MKAYPDTSILASAYLQDGNSSLADQLIANFSASLVLSPLHDFELANAIELAVFRKQVNRSQANAAWKDFQTDLLHWPVTALPVDVFAKAAALARRRSARHGTRSLDMLHVAAAVALGAGIFLSLDGRQRRLARAEKLSIFPRIVTSSSAIATAPKR